MVFRRRRREHPEGRRLVRNGDTFNSEELEREEVELELPDPSGDEPEGGGYEPWARDGSHTETDQDRERLRLYLEFVSRKDREHGDH